MTNELLIVDGDRTTGRALVATFGHAGHAVHWVASGGDALHRLTHAPPPALLLTEVDLPDISGFDVCRSVREAPDLADLPVVFLTLRGDEIDRVVGFEVGADDYVVKPFSGRELLLRVRSILRRTHGTARRGTSFGALRIDQAQHRVWVDDQPIHLTRVEFQLLTLLAERRGRPQSRAQLLADVWGPLASASERTVDTHLHRLRAALGPAHHCIQTVRGVGYRFVHDPVTQLSNERNARR